MHCVFSLCLLGSLSACVPILYRDNGSQDSNGAAQRSKDTGEFRVRSWDNSGPRAGAEVGVFSARGQKVAGHTSQIIEITPIFSASGFVGQVLTADKDGGVLTWNLSRGEAYSLYKTAKKPKVMAFSADGKLFVHAEGKKVEIISLEEQRRLHTLDRIRSRVTSISFFPDLRSVLVGCVDGKVYRWKFTEDQNKTQVGRDRNKTVERYIGHASVISSLTSHPEGRVFFSGDWKGKLFAWLPYDADLYQGKYDKNIFEGEFFSDKAITQVGRVPANQDLVGVRVDQLVSSPDGKYLYVAREGGDLEVWKVRGFSEWTNRTAHRGLIRALDVSPSGKRLVTYGRDDFVRVWSIVTKYDDFADEERGQLKLTYEFPLSKAYNLVFVEESALLVGLNNGKLLEIDLSRLQPAKERVIVEEERQRRITSEVSLPAELSTDETPKDLTK